MSKHLPTNSGSENLPAFHEDDAPRRFGALAVPDLFWPGAMVLIAGTICLVCWGIYSLLPSSAAGSERHLRRALVSPKFNPDSAELPVMPELLPMPQREEQPVVLQMTREPAFLALPMQEISLPVAEPPLLPGLDVGFVAPPPLPQEPVMPPPPPAIEPAALVVPEPPPAPAEALMDPLVFLRSTLGDTPMMRNWKSIAWWSLLTTVIVQAPAPARADDKQEEKTVVQRIDSLQETIRKSFKDAAADTKKLHDSIETLKRDIADLGTGVNSAHEKIRALDEAVKRLRTDFELRENAPGRLALDKSSMEAIRSKLTDIEQAILRLQPTTGRVAMSPPATATTGRMVLVNLYPEELLFTVNQKAYRVAPGANVPVENVPAGVVNYEVVSGTWGLRARTTTNLAPNETVTLTAR